VRWMRLWISLSVPLLLVAVSVRLAMTTQWLMFEYTRPGFSVDAYGMTVQDRLVYGPKGVEYLLNAEEIEMLSRINLPGRLCYPPAMLPCRMFNELELRHMEDVKRVANGFFLVAWGVGLGAGISGLWLWRREKHGLWRAIWRGGVWTLGSMAALAFAALVAWDALFDTFHALFFADGTWQFYYSDSLIRLYPEQFWFETALLVSGLTALGALICVLVGWRRKLRLPLEDASALRET